MEIKNIDLDKIDQVENSRVVYKTVDLAELMGSMKKEGLLQPVGVRKTTGGRYEAVFGNRRILAAKKLGWGEISAHVIDVATDADRDLIGIIENMKRQNTTPAEDGRIFQGLVDGGLSINEISARLDCTVERVKAALEVFHNVPEEFRKKVVYANNGTQTAKLKDRIPATTANAIINLSKRENLNRSQTRSVFQFASEQSPSIQQILNIAPLIKKGYTVREAIEEVEGLTRITLTLYMDEKDRDRLEVTHKCSIHELLTGYLIECKKFKLVSPSVRTRSGLRISGRMAKQVVEGRAG